VEEGTVRADPSAWRAVRSIWIPAAILSLFAVLLRILVATRREGIDIDGITYLQTAEAFVKDWRTISILHPPLYSLILAPFLGFWSDPEWGARVVNAVLGGLWVWPTLWLARETTDEDVSWTAGLLVAVMPAAVEASTRILSEATFGLCLTVFLAVFVRALRTATLGWVGLAGVLGGLATLARPEGIGYLILAGCLLMLAPLLAGTRWTKRLVLMGLGVLSITWFMVLAPYMVVVEQQTGHWNWSGKVGWTLRWAESVGQERQEEFAGRVMTDTNEEDLQQNLVTYIVSRPGEVLSRIVINLHLIDQYMLPKLLHTGGIALVLLGLFFLRFRSGQAPMEWFLAAAPLPFAGLLLFLVEARYFVAIMPVLCIIAGIGVARVGYCGDMPPSRRLSKTGMLLLVVALLSFVPYNLRPWYRQDPPGVEKTAGLWLLRTAGAGAGFIGSYPRIDYYAKSHGLRFARHSLNDLLAEGKKRGARFLIVDNVFLPALRPDFLVLVREDSGRHPDLEVAHVVEDRAGHRVVIYRIKGGAPQS
jgi:4-amino-4-deoxy-L-arabinose transferase-like glycosyltransferase